MNYKKFKDIIGCSPNGRAYIGTYDIAVTLDLERNKCEWDKSEYLLSGKYRIYMTETSRSLNELLFDFYREVGRISLHHKFIDCAKADRYYDKNRIVAPFERAPLVEDMTLDEFAAIQMQYSAKPHMVLPYATMVTMKIMYPLEKDPTKLKKILSMINESIFIRRHYLEYVFEMNKKSLKVPKRLRINGPTIDNYDDDQRPKLTGRKAWEAVDSLNEWAAEMGYSKDNKIVDNVKKPIQTIMEKMHLYDRGSDFDTNIRIVIRSYGRPIAQISTEYFNIKIKKKKDDDDNPEIPIDKIKTYYNKYHDIVHDFVMPLYDKYKAEYKPENRNRFKAVIEKGLIDFLDGKGIPTENAITNIMKEHDEKENNNIMRPKTTELKTWKERHQILQQIIADVAERYNIGDYIIRDEYELNNKMNQIIDLYTVNANSHKIDDMVLPFLARSGA